MVFSTATNENSPSSTTTSTRPSVLRTRTNLVNSPIMKLKRKNSDEQLLPPSKRSSTTILSETTKNPNATLGLTDTFNNKENKKEGKEVEENPLVEKQQQQTQESESKKQVVDEKTRRELEKQEIEELKKNLPFLCEYYDIMEKIGRGTFSTVYKALDIRRDLYDNEEWLSKMLSKPYTGEDKAQHLNDMKNLSEFVALKRVYSTSSPQRISNEIHILQELKGTSCISPLITAFRDGDDTFVVMPYIQNDDFNDLYNTMTLLDIKSYLKSLFTALSQLHQLKIIHKDVKPNNFLYNARKRVGYLIDFGLAQREEETKNYEEKPVAIDDVPLIEPVKGFDTKDPRKQVRANRAGTRGYRAPEVLLRVVHQTTAVDIWSAGIIFLSLLTKVFPFFVGYDEADSIVEIANIFGIQELQKMALKYNRVIHTNIPGLPKQKISLKKLCAYYNGDKLKEWPEKDIRNAMNLLESCLQLDPVTRITAQDALNHPFLHFD